MAAQPSTAPLRAPTPSVTGQPTASPVALSPIPLPDSLNYIGLFLTLECNLNCSYCINDPQQLGRRNALFPMDGKSARKGLTPEQWVAALRRLPFRPGLPITLQGGEPMLYWGGQGLGLILSQVPHYFDLLTNFALKPEVFARYLNGQQAKLQRDAPYPSIRVSYHADEMNRAWNGRGFEALVARCEALRDYGFRISPRKADSDVGIYMVEHPQNRVTAEMKAAYEGRVPFETKEFLGVHDGKLYGRYLYPFSTDLIARGIYPTTLQCECRTTELLIDPMGFVWGCHYYLYEGWSHGGPLREFAALEQEGFRYARHGARIFAGRAMAPVGHLLDPDFAMAELEVFRPCKQYGRCIGCDTKIKNDRFQSYYDRGIPHTSVQIRNIHMPADLLGQIDNLEQTRRFFSATAKEATPMNNALPAAAARKRVLIIKPGYGETLDPDNSGMVSLGDILRTTVILHLFPPQDYHVTWVVDQKGVALLKGNPFIDRLLVINPFTPHLLLSEWFDIVVNFEREPGICAVSDRIPAWRRYGFRLDAQTHTAVCYDHADEALSFTTDAEAKRRKAKSWSEILYEMLGHRYAGQSYVLGYQPRSAISHDVGLNHLIGHKFPLKRWPEPYWQALHDELATSYSVDWQQGANDIEDYIEWIAGCRLLVTNDSLGLHIALGLGKPVIALFGPTVAGEIDGPNLTRITPPLPWDCIPCVESSCSQATPCMQHIPVQMVGAAVRAQLSRQA
ncbi:glycosyltransferase family 9 protein [Methylogaea oryzae]|nr:glycosyltransferase family 9 protein [Methylogaea oryzae]